MKDKTPCLKMFRVGFSNIVRLIAPSMQKNRGPLLIVYYAESKPHIRRSTLSHSMPAVRHRPTKAVSTPPKLALAMNKISSPLDVTAVPMDAIGRLTNQVDRRFIVSCDVGTTPRAGSLVGNDVKPELYSHEDIADPIDTIPTNNFNPLETES